MIIPPCQVPNCRPDRQIAFFFLPALYRTEANYAHHVGTPPLYAIQRTAYRTDGKPAIGRSEGRASAERGYQYPGTGWKGKGLRLSATPLTCIGRDEITQMAHVRVAEGANEFGRDLDSASERRQ